MHKTCRLLTVFVNPSNLTEINYIKLYVSPVYVAKLCHTLYLEESLTQNHELLHDVHQHCVNNHMSQ
jgi:hypothetical protein